MKISISNKTQERPRPVVPSVSLTFEAYDALLALSTKHNISMRRLASEIIMSALDNIEIERVGE